MIPGLSDKSRACITALKAMELKDSAGQSLVKVETDAGLEGYGEAGASGPEVRAHLKDMEPVLLNEDPLSVERLYDTMASSQHTYRAHIPTVSGVDIALWDLAGKILNQSISELITGQYRDEILLYYTENSPDMLDRSVCQDWVDDIKAYPDGYRTLKFGFEPLCGHGVHAFKGTIPSQTLTAMEVEVIRIDAGKPFRNDAMQLDVGTVFFQAPPHCGNRPTGTHARHEFCHPPAGLLEDFDRGGVIVGLPVVFVRVLIAEKIPIGIRLRSSMYFTECFVIPFGWIGKDDAGSVGIDPFFSVQTGTCRE